MTNIDCLWEPGRSVAVALFRYSTRLAYNPIDSPFRQTKLSLLLIVLNLLTFIALDFLPTIIISIYYFNT